MKSEEIFNKESGATIVRFSLTDSGIAIGMSIWTSQIDDWGGTVKDSICLNRNDTIKLVSEMNRWLNHTTESDPNHQVKSMKIKKLELIFHSDSGFYRWYCKHRNQYYSWSKPGFHVSMSWQIETLGVANTLEEADALVQTHHEQQAKELMAILLEPETPTTSNPNQQVTGQSI
jgi:hypothetical protein